MKIFLKRAVLVEVGLISRETSLCHKYSTLNQTCLLIELCVLVEATSRRQRYFEPQLYCV